MFDTVTCPNCNRRLQLHVDHMGQQVQCPTCETTFIAGETKPRPQKQPTPPPAPEAITTTPTPSAPPPSEARDREPRRTRRLERTPPKKSGTSGLVLGILVVVGVVVGVGVLVFAGRNQRDRNIQFGNNFAQPMFNVMPPQVDVPDRILDAEEQKQQARMFFQHFSAIMRVPNHAGETASFDASRLLSTALEQNLIPMGLRNERGGQLENDFRQGVWNTSLYRGEIHWGNFLIMTVKQPRPLELVVVTRHPNETTNTSLRLRWWLAHVGGRWLITEVEDLDYGVRLSMLLAGALPGVDPGVRSVRDAADAIIIRTNFDDADRILAPVRVNEIPKACAATHQMLTASIRLRQRRWDDVLAACTAAQGFQPDTPGADYQRAIANNNLRRDAIALKHAQAARAWMGDDPAICYEIGIASGNTGQFVEAAKFYRLALDANPNHKDAYLSLLRCMGPNVKNDDLGERLRKMPRPGENFQLFANDCWLARDMATLAILTDTMLKIEPRHGEAHFYRSLVEADRDRLAAALASFRSALEMQGFDGRREVYYADFARAVVARDLTLRAYAQLPDAQRAFRALGDELKMSGKIDDLPQLIALHVKKQPNDPYVHLFQAELHMRDEQYALADKSFTKAFAEINDPAVHERYRFNRINARYHIGDILGAYRDITPHHSTFQQLANSCWAEKKSAELKSLVAAHAKNDPFDPQVARFRWRLAILDQQYDVAGKRLKAELGKNPVGDADKRLLEDFLFDMIDAGQALEGYRQAPEPSAALDVIGIDLANGNRPEDMQAVLDAHRKAFPNDPMLKMYAGQQAADKQDWAGAVAAYRDGWSLLPDLKRARWSHGYMTAAVKLGNAVGVYRDTGKRPELFRQLASMLLGDKKIDAFEDLLKAHRPEANLDADLPAYEARLLLVKGQHAEAADLLVKHLKDKLITEQRRVGDLFLADVGTFDLAVEAYRCIPDKRDAFAHMIWKYRTPERVKEFARLIDEHATQHADDPRLRLERAELHLLKKEYAQAEKEFVQAKLANPKDTMARFGLIRARIKLGKAAATYRELGANQLAFVDVANQCIFLKNGAQLESVLTSHRQAFPAAKNLAVWDVEVLYHKKDYAGTLKALRADATLLKSQNSKWKCEAYLVRSLVHLKKFDEAIGEAEAIAKRRDGSQILLALAIASSGDMKRFTEFMDKKRAQRFFLEDCYRDDDLGALLRSDAFRTMRERYPPPPNVLPGGRFDDFD